MSLEFNILKSNVSIVDTLLLVRELIYGSALSNVIFIRTLSVIIYSAGTITTGILKFIDYEIYEGYVSK